jgi:hypothetical protein
VNCWLIICAKREKNVENEEYYYKIIVVILKPLVKVMWTAGYKYVLRKEIFLIEGWEGAGAGVIFVFQVLIFFSSVTYEVQTRNGGLRSRRNTCRRT